MEIPQLTKAEKRVILALGRSAEDKPMLSELADEVGVHVQLIQKGKRSLEDESFIKITKDHPKCFVELTEFGEELYEHLKEYIEILKDRED